MIRAHRHRGTALGGHREKVDFCKPRRGLGRSLACWRLHLRLQPEREGMRRFSCPLWGLRCRSWNRCLQHERWLSHGEEAWVAPSPRGSHLSELAFLPWKCPMVQRLRLPPLTRCYCLLGLSRGHEWAHIRRWAPGWGTTPFPRGHLLIAVSYHLLPPSFIL